MIKKTLLLVSVVALVATGCSSTDQRYKREAEGNFDYLNTQALIPLVVPEGVTLPPSSSVYYIYKAAKEGTVGKDVDIRPPVLPIPTIVDAYAVYSDGKVVLDYADYSSVWTSLPPVLQAKNIPITTSNNNVIETDKTLISTVDQATAVEASYLLTRTQKDGREYLTLSLTSLQQNGQDIVDPVERQRYTVSLFNTLMSELAPKSTPNP